MKIDPYRNKEKFLNWKNKGSKIEGVSKESEKFIVEFVNDMEQGLNIGKTSKRGSRSYIRLNSYRYKLKKFAELFEKYFKKNIVSITKEEFHKLCKDMRDGKITREDGKTYTDPSDYISSFRAFWNWHIKTSKKNIPNITEEVAINKEKPKWVYLTEEQFKQLVSACSYDYRFICQFMLITGLRAGEFKNIRISNFKDDFKFLDVPDEISKTIGRNIKTLTARELIKDYIKLKGLSGDDLLCSKSPTIINRYLKRTTKKVFGDEISSAGKPYSSLTLGDFRHNSACYWLPRYPNPQGMMYRFGWKRADKIYYYSEFMGMIDNVSEEDMLIDVTRSELQKELDKIKTEREIDREEMKRLAISNKMFATFLEGFKKNLSGEITDSEFRKFSHKLIEIGKNKIK